MYVRREAEAELEETRPHIHWRRPVLLDDGYGCRFCRALEGDWRAVVATEKDFPEHMMAVHGRTTE